jgi:hypothetical protein
MVGDAIAQSAMVELRELNQGRRKIGRALRTDR